LSPSPERLDHLPGGVGARADVPYFALPDQVVQRTQGLVDGHRGLGTVDLIEVDVIGLQTAQTVFTGFHDVKASIAPGIRIRVVHLAVHFGREEDFVALTALFERDTCYRLAFAAPIDVGGIDKVTAPLQKAVDHSRRFALFRFPSEGHRAQTQHTHLRPGTSQRSRFHPMSPLFFACVQALPPLYAHDRVLLHDRPLDRILWKVMSRVV
jgi:hypothetical protein